MAPNQSATLFENAAPVTSEAKTDETKPEYKMQIVWHNVFIFIYLHGAFVYAFYLTVFKLRFITFAWAFLVGLAAGMGVTAGSHRLWSHRSYKAKWQMRVILAIFQSMAGQTSIYTWVRDHRLHHKYSETDADPHNATRGFFYSHMGWLLCRRHPETIRKGKDLDLSDIVSDPVVMFQKKWYVPMVLIFNVVFPAIVPWYFWNETLWNSWYVAVMFRFVLTLNLTWLINSAAHHFNYGTRAYDKNIHPTDSIEVSIAAFGEGYHNFHHTFPWDYRSAELAVTNRNLTTGFIHMFARIGWAYDLKYASEDLIRKRALRTGDGTYDFKRGLQSKDGQNFYGETNVWGWGDIDMPIADQKATVRERCQL